MSDTGLHYKGSGRPVTDYNVVRHFVLTRDHHTCRACGGTADQVDHVWPRKHGGTDHVENLQAICGTCNRIKGDRVDLRSADTQQLLSGIEAAAERAKKALREMDEFLEALAARPDDRSTRLVAETVIWTVSSEARYRAGAIAARESA